MNDAGDPFAGVDAKHLARAFAIGREAGHPIRAKPMTCAAVSRFMQTAPADSSCSKTGILAPRSGRLTTITTTGAARKTRAMIAVNFASLAGLHSRVLDRIARAEQFARAVAGLAFDHDEAPGFERAMVRRATGIGQHAGKLGLARPRLADEADARGAATLQQRQRVVNAKGHHVQS